MTIKLELSGEQEARLLEAQVKVDRDAAMLVLLEALPLAITRLVGQSLEPTNVEARRQGLRQLTADLQHEYQKLRVKPAHVATTREEIYGDLP